MVHNNEHEQGSFEQIGRDNGDVWHDRRSTFEVAPLSLRATCESVGAVPSQLVLRTVR
jgi:hypothetical protein